jgi:hypothetical protein
MASSQSVQRLEVLPCEHKKVTDPETGAELTFLTTNPEHDQSLYYEQRSWLCDSSLILLNSGRPSGGLMGYLTATGELVRLATSKGGLGGATCARSKNSVYGIRGNTVVELALDIQPRGGGAATPTVVTAMEREVCTLSEDQMPTNTSLSESCDGAHLSVGAGGRSISTLQKDAKVLIIEVETGAIKELYQLPGKDFGGHVMMSLTNPNLVSFGEFKNWITVMDIRTGEKVFEQKKIGGEFCTHHCWWENDTITYCGGFHPQPLEDADVKVLDFNTGTIRIIGKGSWWPGATSTELARANWWHSCGHESGRWVAADNWHGDIGIFHGKTTRTYMLTKGHRTYGGGTHPEVGWDRKGEKVIFASHMLGNVDVCVAAIPEVWQTEWEEQVQQSRKF